MKVIKVIGRAFVCLAGIMLSGICVYFTYSVLRYGERDLGSDDIWFPIMFLTAFAIFGVISGLMIAFRGLDLWDK